MSAQERTSGARVDVARLTCCDGTGWTGNPYERCLVHYDPNDLSEFR